jgi:hypothetical protein
LRRAGGLGRPGRGGAGGRRRARRSGNCDCRRFGCLLSAFWRLVIGYAEVADIIHGVLNGDNLLSVFVGDAYFALRIGEFFLQRHDKFYQIQGISAQVIDEAGAWGNLFFCDAELVYGNFADTFKNGRQIILPYFLLL